MLFLPGCDSLGVHRAAGDGEAKLGAVAIVVVAGVIGRDILVLLGEYLDAYQKRTNIGSSTEHILSRIVLISFPGGQ